MEDRWSSVRRFEGRDEDRPSRKKGKEEKKNGSATVAESQTTRRGADFPRLVILN